MFTLSTVQALPKKAWIFAVRPSSKSRAFGFGHNANPVFVVCTSWSIDPWSPNSFIRRLYTAYAPTYRASWLSSSRTNSRWSGGGGSLFFFHPGTFCTGFGFFLGSSTGGGGGDALGRAVTNAYEDGRKLTREPRVWTLCTIEGVEGVEGGLIVACVGMGDPRIYTLK